MSVPVLAPEAISGIQSATVAMEREAERLAATGDPIHHTIAVSARIGTAAGRLLLDASLKSQAQADAVAQALQDARKPWTRDEIRMLVTQLDRTLMHRWTQFNRVAVAVAVAVTVAFGAICWGGGYWYRGAAPALAGVRAGSDHCDDRQDGSRLCWIPVWQRLPPSR